MWTKDLLPLFERRKSSLIESLRAARTGADGWDTVASLLDDLGREFEAGLTHSEKRVATPLLRVLRRSCGCLSAFSRLDEGSLCAVSEPRQDNRSARAVAASLWEDILKLFRRQRQDNRVAQASGASIDSPSPASSTIASRLVALDPDKLAAALTEAISVFDQACRSLDPEPHDEPHETHHVDLEIVEFLQQLEGDSRQLAGQRFLTQRIKQVPDLLKRLGMRSIWPDDSGAAAEQDWFEKVVDPNRSEPAADFPAIVGERGLVLEGRVLIPPAKS